jgi:hypothetical protein
MSTITLRLPDDTHDRLRKLAKHRAISVNKLMEELATISIAGFDAENRFRVMAGRGSVTRGLELLDKLDAASKSPQQRTRKPQASPGASASQEASARGTAKASRSKGG